VGRGGASQPKAQTAEKSVPKGTSTGITILKRNLDGKESIRAAATGTPTLPGPIQKEKEVVAATTHPPKAKEASTPMICKDQGKVTQTDPRAESKGETPRPRSPETDVPKSFSKAVGSRTRTTVTAQTLTKGVKELADSPPAGSANLDKETQINVVASVMSTVREPVMPKSKQARKFKKVVPWMFITRDCYFPKGVADMLDFMESTKDGAGKCHADGVASALHFAERVGSVMDSDRISLSPLWLSALKS
jgi:hypothetical protein